MTASHNNAKNDTKSSPNTTTTSAVVSRPPTFEEMACSETSTVDSVKSAIGTYYAHDVKNYAAFKAITIAAARYDHMEILLWVKQQLIDPETSWVTSAAEVVDRRYHFFCDALAKAILHDREQSFHFLLPLVKKRINELMRHLEGEEFSKKYPNIFPRLIDTAVYTQHYHFIDSLLIAGADIKQYEINYHTLHDVLKNDRIIKRLQRAGLNINTSLGGANAFAQVVSCKTYNQDFPFLNNSFKPTLENLRLLLDHQLDDYLLSKLNQCPLDDLRVIAEEAKTDAMKYLLRYFVAASEYKNAKYYRGSIQKKFFTHYQQQWQQAATQVLTVSSAAPQEYIDEINTIAKQDSISVNSIKVTDSKDAKAEANQRFHLIPLLEKYATDAKATVQDIEDICLVQYRDKIIKNYSGVRFYIGFAAAYCGNMALLQWVMVRDVVNKDLWLILHRTLVSYSDQAQAIDYLFDYLIKNMSNFVGYCCYGPQYTNIAFLLITHNKLQHFNRMLAKNPNEIWYLQADISYNNVLHKAQSLFGHALALGRDRLPFAKSIIACYKKQDWDMNCLFDGAIDAGRDELMDDVFQPTQATLTVLLKHKKFAYLNKVSDQFPNEVIQIMADEKKYQSAYEHRTSMGAMQQHSAIPPATVALFKSIHAFNSYNAIDSKQVDASTHQLWFNHWVETVRGLVEHYTSELSDQFPAIARKWIAAVRHYATWNATQLEAAAADGFNPCASYYLCEKYFAANKIDDAKKHYALACPLFASQFSVDIRQACYVAPISPPAVAPSIAAIHALPTIADMSSCGLFANGASSRGLSAGSSVPDVKTSTSPSSTAIVNNAIATVVATTPTDVPIVVVHRIEEGETEGASAPVPPGSAAITALIDSKAEPNNFYRLLPPPASVQPDYVTMLDVLTNAIHSGTVSDQTLLTQLRVRAEALTTAITAKLSQPAPSAPSEVEGISSSVLKF